MKFIRRPETTDCETSRATVATPRAESVRTPGLATGLEVPVAQAAGELGRFRYRPAHARPGSRAVA